MKELFLTYEQSLALKELGFDEPCFKKYIAGCLWSSPTTPEIYENVHSNSSDCLAPLKQQAFKFFREKYNLLSEILLDKTTYPKYCFEINKYEDFGNYEKIKIEDWGLYRNYEEAENACIDKLINIVKNKEV